ncbi:MAG: O-antigen ligase family protein [Okeania sp. SIO3B3]|nr:O-antigen ligase family protein [Okeania sp. SIO3B3]
MNQDTTSHPLPQKSRSLFCLFLAFIIGLTSRFAFNFIGTVYVGELLCAALLPFLFVIYYREVVSSRTLIVFLILTFIMLLGFVASDLVRGNTFQNYIRGWAKVVFLGLSITTVSILGLKDKRCIPWLFIGLSISLLFNKLKPDTGVDDALGWKWNYGYAASYLVVAISPRLHPLIFTIASAGLSLFSFIHRFRSLGGQLIFTVGLSFYSRYFRRKKQSKASYVSIALALIFSIVLMAGIIALSPTALIQEEKDSSHGRLQGILGGIHTVIQSPIIGFGSWASTAELAEAQRDYFKSHGNKSLFEKRRTIGAHSQLLDTWMAGGILAALFFIFLFYMCFWGILRCTVQRAYDSFTSPIIFLCMITLWHILQSPFGGYHRFTIALTIMSLVILKKEIAEDRASATEPLAPPTFETTGG